MDKKPPSVEPTVPHWPAVDPALSANSQEEAERLIGKVNIIGKARLVKLNVNKTKLLKIGKMPSNAGATVDDEHI